MDKEIIGQIDEIEKNLARFTVDLREKKLKTALRKASQLINTRIQPNIPADGKYKGGIAYTERKGARARRPPLSESLSIVVKGYQEAVVAVGGPLARIGGRHAHLVERGFQHVSGGTLANSGGRTRYAMKTTHYDLVDVGAGVNRRKMWMARRQRNDKRRGTGRVNRKIPGRPYLTPAVSASKTEVDQLIIRYLQRAAKRFEKGLATAEVVDV